METFITTIVLSLGIAGPLLSAMDFVDSLAKVGTIVGSVDEILNGQEQDHGNAPVQFHGWDITISHVSFGYHADKEVLHDVSLTIPAGTMTAFVGPSGSGKSTIAKLIAGFWDVVRRHHHSGRTGFEKNPSPSSTTRWPSYPRTTTFLMRASGRISVWAAPLPLTREVEAVAKGRRVRRVYSWSGTGL